MKTNTKSRNDKKKTKLLAIKIQYRTFILLHNLLKGVLPFLLACDKLAMRFFQIKFVRT